MAGGVGMSAAMDGATVDVLIGVRVTDGHAEVVTEQSSSRRHRPITAVEARVLTNRIRTSLSAVWQLLESAYVDRAWAAMGYSSWDVYCAAEFGESRITIPREEREAVVRSLREAGLSYRAIESATKLPSRTARRATDTPGGANAPPDVIKGKDGKQYPATRPAAKPTVGPSPTPPNVIDGSVDADDNLDADAVTVIDDELIECDTCGEGHPPEITICPWLRAASEGPLDPDREYRLSHSAESSASVGLTGTSIASHGDVADINEGKIEVVAVDGRCAANGDELAAASPGMRGLRAVALGVKRLSDARDELDRLSSLAGDVSGGLDAVEGDSEVRLPAEELVDEIRQAVGGLRSQVALLDSTLDVWEAMADRIANSHW